MKHIWSIFCRTMIEDKTTNNPSLIEVTERIGFKAELPDERPVALPFPYPLFVVSNWWRDSEDDKSKYPSRVRFISPDQVELRKIEYEVNLEESGRMRTFGQIAELPFTVNGIYEFEVAYKNNEDWEVVASIPLEIFHEQPDDQPESEPIE